MLLLHFVIMCYLAFYGILSKKSIHDYFYLWFVYVLVLHWTFFNGECCLSYFYKKQLVPTYIAGSDTSIEFKWVFKHHSNLIDRLSNVRNILILISIYLVAKRNHIPFLFYLPFLILSGLLICRSHFFTDCHTNKNYHLFQEVIKYLLLGYLVWGIYQLKHIK
jgi:hypothetical protein